MEALAEGRGLLAEFQTPHSIGRCICMLLEHDELREHCQRSARAYGRAMSSAKVGQRYADIFRAVAAPALRLPLAARAMPSVPLHATLHQPIAAAQP